MKMMMMVNKDWGRLGRMIPLPTEGPDAHRDPPSSWEPPVPTSCLWGGSRQRAGGHGVTAGGSQRSCQGGRAEREQEDMGTRDRGPELAVASLSQRGLGVTGGRGARGTHEDRRAVMGLCPLRPAEPLQILLSGIWPPNAAAGSRLGAGPGPARATPRPHARGARSWRAKTTAPACPRTPSHGHQRPAGWDSHHWRGTEPRTEPQDRAPGQSPGQPLPAALTWTMALEPTTSSTCPLRLVPLGSVKLTISAYWANWGGGGQAEVGGQGGMAGSTAQPPTPPHAPHACPEAQGGGGGGGRARGRCCLASPSPERARVPSAVPRAPQEGKPSRVLLWGQRPRGFTP